MLKATKGNQVKVHYRGILMDGTEFDNSYTRGDPIGFEIGAGQMLGGFDAAVEGMKVGEKKTVTLTPDVAYGEVNAAATTEIPREAFPEGLELEAGMPVPLASPDGHRLVGTVSQLNESVVTVDLNHPLAGQELKFDIELVEIEDPSV